MPSLRRLPPEEKARIAEAVIERYNNGEKIYQIAPTLGTSARTLYRLLDEVAPKSWLAAQEAEQWVRLDDEFDSRKPEITRTMKSAQFRLDRIEARRRRRFS